MQFQNLLRTTERFIRARLHFWMGRFWLLIGRKSRAEKEFREVLSHLGEDFRTSLYLGRLALEAGDLPGALREMSAARRQSPARFARLRAEIWRSFSKETPPKGIGLRGALDSDKRLAGSGSKTPSGMAASGSSGAEGKERGRPASQPLPQFYYWQRTPDSFDFEADSRNQSHGDHTNNSDAKEGQRPLFFGSDSSKGNDDDAARDAGKGDWDSWFLGEGLFHDERNEESPWTDFLSHHYFFDSLPLGENDESGDDEECDSLAEDPFEFLSDEESEALSPWTDHISSEEDQAEDDQFLQSPLAGFYEELEDARQQADGGVPEPHGPRAHGHERFHGLPPIRESELNSVDWDELLNKLANDGTD